MTKPNEDNHLKPILTLLPEGSNLTCNIFLISTSYIYNSLNKE